MRGKIDFEQADILQFTFSIGKDLPRFVAATDCRAEEPEIGRLPRDQAETLSFDEQFRTFLHSLRDDAQSL